MKFNFQVVLDIINTLAAAVVLVELNPDINEGAAKKASVIADVDKTMADVGVPKAVTSIIDLALPWLVDLAVSQAKAHGIFANSST